MRSTQTFSRGMNKDLDNSLPRTNTYLDALNLRLNTDKGQSEAALNNVIGNSAFGIVPDTSAVWICTQIGTLGRENDSSTLFTFTITINAIVKTLSIYGSMSAVVDAINANASFSHFDAFLSDDGTFFYLTSLDGTPITTFTISTVYGSGVTAIYLAAQTGLMPIGWTTIREEIILLTTSVTSHSPTNGAGQIWRLTYNEVTLAPTYTLLYNNIVNFTTWHPVAPSAITSRYENANTKRIYWTDNYNQLRHFNTADSNAFTLDPTSLDLQIPADGSIPILKEITAGGTTKVGMYQAAYRLKNSSTVTSFSELSNLVSIVAESEQKVVGGANSTTYVGAAEGTLAAKTIHWEIKGIDTDYDRIEIVVLFYNTFNANPVITLIQDEEIPVSGKFTFSYSGNESIDTITAEEFLLQTFSFTHCKTLTTKDNRLIIANTRDTKTDFTYDARAYQFYSNSKILDLNDAQGGQVSYNISTNTANKWALVPETYDAINPAPDNYKYKWNSTDIGGTGPNISYSFGTYCVKGDSTIELADGQKAPFAHTNPRYDSGIINLGVTGQDYLNNGTNDGLKYAYRSGLLKGYQRNETYRFAIVFYDKQCRALFARWIGDIRMPDYGDVNPNPDPIATLAGIPADFRLSWRGTATVDGGTNNAYLNLLYVKFDVSIPTTIKQYIGGYRICRVERTKNDKSIIGAGLLTQMLSDGGGFYIPSTHPDNPYVTNDLNLASGGTAAGGYPQNYFMFDSPDFHLTGYPGRQSGDAISIGQRLDTLNTTRDVTPSDSGESEPYRILKLLDAEVNYDFSTTAFAVNEGIEVAYNQQCSFTGTSFDFHNWCQSDSSHFPGIGSKTVAVGLNNVLSYSTAPYSCSINSFVKLYALYYRTVTNQYGGNSYSAKTRNEYIPCGSFQPIISTTTATSFSQQVFGGDIFLDVYDSQKLIKNFANISGRAVASGPARVSFSYFFPCESSHNFNLRHGIHINKDLEINTGSQGFGYGASFQETYDYNIVYSSENNFKTFVPKPADFLATEENDTRIWFSEEKQDGELKDSWNQFKPTSYYDAESFYGPINSLISFKDKVFYFQDRGFGIVPINDRTLVSTANTGTDVETSIGRPLDVIQRPEYISQTIGCKHQWGVTTSDNAIYFFDINTKQLFQYAAGQIIPLPGMNAYFRQNLTGNILTSDNPVASSTTSPRVGMNCTVDFKNHDVLFTFFDYVPTTGGFLGQGTKRRFTVAYNEKPEFRCFTSFYSFTPALYINNRKYIITPFTKDPSGNPFEATTLNQLWIHDTGARCSFYGTVYDSTLKALINPFPNKSKIFNNLEWYTQSINTSGVNLLTDTWKRARVYNDYQNTDYKTLTPDSNIKRKERGWRFGVPRNAVKPTGTNLDIFASANINQNRLFKEPIRDVYTTVDLVYQNTGNNRFISPLLTTEYLVSPR